MLAEIFLNQLQFKVREAATGNPSRSTSDPRFVPVALPPRT